MRRPYGAGMRGRSAPLGHRLRRGPATRLRREAASLRDESTLGSVAQVVRAFNPV